MHLFSAFGILGLLHVARGGELDQFATQRAHHIRAQHLAGRQDDPRPLDSPTSAKTHSSYADVPANSIKLETVIDNSKRHLLVARLHGAADNDRDGEISYKEFIKSLLFSWNSTENLEAALSAFHLPSASEIFNSMDENGDGYISMDEHSSFSKRSTTPETSPPHCSALRTKAESCATKDILKCAPYFSAAEGMCLAGHPNLVETCILSNPCASICECIANVGAAAKNKAVMYIQHPDSSVHIYQPEHEKRLFFLAWIFYGLIAFAILEYSSLALAALITHFAGSDINDSRWMDVKIWEKGDPPDCSMYLYWGDCGAIGTAASHRCPGGGVRVYGNSCKDHFRYGSRGCGFWGLGCQSVCYNINYARCPCSIFKWAQVNDFEVQTSQPDISTQSVTQPSQCRAACENNVNCVAYVLFPADGKKDQKNCVLKAGLILSYRDLKDVTSFIRDGKKPGEQCGDITKKKGSFWDEFGNPGVGKRSTGSDVAPILEKRVNENKAYAFDGRDPNFNRWLAFMTLLYVQNWIMRERTVQRYPFLQRAVGAPRMRPSQDGFPNLGNPAAPRWSPQEVNARLTNLVRNMMFGSAPIAANPVQHYLDNVVGSNTNTYMQEQWPQAVRDLLIANQAAIQPAGQSTNDPNIPTWDGRRADTSTRSYWPTHTGVQVGLNANPRIGQWYQTGNSGPYGLEAAFLLAAQLAGVNWRYVWNRGIGSDTIQPWWTGAIVRRVAQTGEPDVSVDCIMDDGLNADGTQGEPRRIGIQQVVNTESTDAHGRAGVYFALDLDPDLADDDPNHNVFLFVSAY